MTCIIDGCTNPVRGENCRTCHMHIHDVARHGSGRAKAWSDFDMDRDPAKIEANKKLSARREAEATVRNSRNTQRRAT